MNPSPIPFLDLTMTRKIRRIFIAMIGGTVLVFGVALVVLPGPAVLVIPAGLAILAVEFAWAGRWLLAGKEFVKRNQRFIPGRRGAASKSPAQEPTPIVPRCLRPEENL